MNEKLGFVFSASSLFVWSCNYFLCIYPSVFSFIYFGIHFFLALIDDILLNLIKSKFQFLSSEFLNVYYSYNVFVLGQLYLGRWGCHLITVVCILSVLLWPFTPLFMFSCLIAINVHSDTFQNSYF